MRLNMDVSQIPDDEYVDLPDGTYTVLIESIEGESTKDGQGNQLKVTMVVNDPQYANKKVWDRICYDHHGNPVRAEIGRKTWKKLCAACGFTSGDVDTDLLVNKNVKIVLKTRDGYQNVSKYIGVMPSQSAPVQPQTPVAGYAQTQPQQVPQTATIQDDDIPF